MTAALTDTLLVPDEADGLLLEAIVGFLAPLLMMGGLTDISLARMVARETIAAYQTSNREQLISVAQIVGFALASLDNLRLSAAPDLPLSMTLRLRGNANVLNSASHRATAALEAQRHASENCGTEEPDDTVAQAEALASVEQARALVRQAKAVSGRSGSPQGSSALNSPAASPVETSHSNGAGSAASCVRAGSAESPGTMNAPAPSSVQPTPAYEIRAAAADEKPAADPTPRFEQGHGLSWADAMTDVAAECSRGLAKLPPVQRRAEIIRIEALSEAVRHLTQNGNGVRRPDLLASTSLGSPL